MRPALRHRPSYASVAATVAHFRDEPFTLSATTGEQSVAVMPNVPPGGRSADPVDHVKISAIQVRHLTRTSQ